jgi:hypothetical protein
MRADRTTWIGASQGGPFGRGVVLATLSGLALLGAGCQQATPPAEPAVTEMSHADHADTVDPAVVAAEMAKLSPEDREQAILQGYCVVSREPLGSMGIPLKVSVEGEKSVFVCCEGCEEMVRSNPEKMLARLPELQARVKADREKAGSGPVEAPPEQPAEPVVESAGEPAPQEPESAPKPADKTQ